MSRAGMENRQVSPGVMKLYLSKVRDLVTAVVVEYFLKSPAGHFV